MPENQHPFVMSALLSKRPSAETTTYSSRGGITWAATADEAKGKLLTAYLDDGYSVDILDVRPLAQDTVIQIAEYAARVALSPAEPTGGEQKHG